MLFFLFYITYMKEIFLIKEKNKTIREKTKNIKNFFRQKK